MDSGKVVFLVLCDIVMHLKQPTPWLYLVRVDTSNCISISTILIVVLVRSFVNLTDAKVIWEDGTSIEKMSHQTDL